MTNSGKLWFLVGLILTGVLLYFLASILTPFLLAAVLAYLGDPLVNRLIKFKVPRTLAATLVFILIFFIVLFLPLLLLPLLQDQIAIFIAKLPAMIQWVQQVVVPWINYFTGGTVSFNFETIKSALTEHWQQAGNAAAVLWAALSHSGLALLGLTIRFLIMAVVTFYLLRDWPVVVENICALFPRRIEPLITKLIKECDQVLSAFFRGQLLVMLLLSIIYGFGLKLVGLQVALLVGVIAGLMSIIPYLGVILGILIAGIAAVVQFQDWLHLIYVLIVFGVGHGIEVSILTPLLIGDKIGLHPVAVIFAILAGGQLFGFFGVLLALPVAAVLMVLLRHGRHHYIHSNLYRRKPRNAD